MKSDISLLDISIIVIRRKFFLLINFICISIVAVVISFLIPEWYQSEVVFIPRSASGGSFMGLVGGMGSPNIVGEVPLKKRHYIEILYSRQLRERLIEEFDLVTHYEHEDMPNPIDRTLKKLLGHITISEVEEGGLGMTDVLTIKIAVEDKDPVLAADMANFLYEEMQKRILSYLKQEHDATMSFLDEVIEKQEVALSEARQNLFTFQVEHQVYDLPEQLKQTLIEMSGYQAAATAADIEMNLLLRQVGASHPQVRQLRLKRDTYIRQTKELETSSNRAFGWPIKESIELGYRYFDLKRDVEISQRILSLLIDQKTQTEIKFHRTFADVFLVDPARPAEWKHRPKKAPIVIVITFLYMISLISWIIISELTRQQMKVDPVLNKKIEDLRSALFKK